MAKKSFWVKAGLYFFALFFFMALALPGLRSIYVARLAKDLKIDSPGGIEVLEELEINGMKQWVLIRGKDRKKPVLLFLAGGPGFSNIFYVQHNLRLEDEFVVVQWDQRASGKTFASTIEKDNISIADFVKDAQVLTDHLKKRFSVDKIFLAGHSWGGSLGLALAQARPQDYHALVSLSPVVDLKRGDQIIYDRLRKMSRDKEHSWITKELDKIGSPPYNLEGYNALQAVVFQTDGCLKSGPCENRLLMMGITSPYYKLSDYAGILEALERTWKAVYEEYVSIDYTKAFPRLKVPVYFIAGVDDLICPAELVKEHYQKIRAPQKRFYLFEKSAHFTFLEEPERFQDIMIHEVLRNIKTGRF